MCRDQHGGQEGTKAELGLGRGWVTLQYCNNKLSNDLTEIFQGGPKVEQGK